MIALEHLHVINVIHQEGSFSKASERLFKARSAVSYSVKQVEEYYQVQIFTRDTYRPELTSNGRILLKKIQHLLNEAEEFDLFASQMNGEVERELRISISAIFPMKKVTSLLSELKTRFPDTIIHLEIETASGEQLLLDDKVDIGIYGGLQQDSRVQYRYIETCHLPVVISAQALNSDGQLPPEALYEYPQIVVKSSYKPVPDTGFLEQGQQWFVSDLHSKKTLICDGLGWGRLPLHQIETELQAKKLVVVDSQKETVLPIYLAKQKNRPLGAVGMAIWNFFEDSSER